MSKEPKECFSETANELPFEDDTDPLFLPEEDEDMGNMYRASPNDGRPLLQERTTGEDSDSDLMQVQQIVETGHEGRNQQLDIPSAERQGNIALQAEHTFEHRIPPVNEEPNAGETQRLIRVNIAS